MLLSEQDVLLLADVVLELEYEDDDVDSPQDEEDVEEDVEETVEDDWLYDGPQLLPPHGLAAAAPTRAAKRMAACILGNISAL